MTHLSRGAAVIETVAVTVTALIVCFGAIQLGLIGYAQISADGAAYVAQHMSDIGSGGYTVPTTIYPTIAKNEIQTTDLNATHPDQQYVDYNYAATSDRHGGASYTGAFRQETVVHHTTGFTLPFVNVLSGAVIRGTSISTLLSEAGPSWNLGGSTAPTLSNSQSYVKSNDHAAPYFLARNTLLRCSDPAPWATCTTTVQYSYASAEYLDSDNDGRTVPGVSPTGTATFFEMACHQRAYAKFATNLPTTLPAYGSPQRLTLQAAFVSDPEMTTRIRNWEVPQTPPGSSTGNPLTPGSGC